MRRFAMEATDRGYIDSLGGESLRKFLSRVWIHRASFEFEISCAAPLRFEDATPPPASLISQLSRQDQVLAFILFTCFRICVLGS